MLGQSETKTPGAQGAPCCMAMWSAVAWGGKYDPRVLVMAAAPELPGYEMSQASGKKKSQLGPYEAFNAIATTVT